MSYSSDLSPGGAHAPAATVSINKISWSAVLAGVVIALIVQLLLSMLGFGVGLATVDPAGDGSPEAATLSMSAGIWWVIAGVIAAAAGGYVAGRASGATQLTVGVLHGLTSWAATTLIVLYLLTTTIGGLVGGAFSGVTSALGGAGQAAMATAQSAAPALSNVSDPFGSIESNIRSASGGDDPAALRDKAISATRAALSADPAQQEQAKTQAAEALAKAQNIPVDQARSQIDAYQTQYRQTMDQAKQKATDAADAAATAGSAGALIAFFALVLGAAAAAFAGRMGVTALRGW
ncbi:PhnA-like protein [Hansschlegelia sp. KR7-227]|uniref:PhnA-like protein n=1 Tax=Hansschlegelia sp. KR7-227 TaxID=3400914 RepID=UPI003C0FA0D8